MRHLRTYRFRAELHHFDSTNECFDICFVLLNRPRYRVYSASVLYTDVIYFPRTCSLSIKRCCFEVKHTFIGKSMNPIVVLIGCIKTFISLLYNNK